MKKVLIYGAKLQAQQLCFYMENEGVAEAAAFVVDPGYRTADTLDGLPVATFEEALERYPPETHEFAVSFAYGHMVHDRREKALRCKAHGYRLFTFVSRHATVFAGSVGEGCIIYPGCNISFGVEIGEGNFFETGVTIAHHTRIGEYNFFAPAAVVCGDVVIGEHNFIGANATVMNGARLGREVLVAAGTVVRDVEDGGVYFPGRAVKWRGRSTEMKIP